MNINKKSIIFTEKSLKNKGHTCTYKITHISAARCTELPNLVLTQVWFNIYKNYFILISMNISKKNHFTY